MTDDAAIWNDDVRSLTMSSDNGGPPPPFIPTEQRPAELIMYGLSVTHPPMLVASLCIAQYNPDGPLPIEHQASIAVISAAQFDALVPTLKRLRVIDTGQCGNDTADIHLTVTTGSGSTEYADSFYAGCPGRQDDRPVVDTAVLDVVEAAFHKLAFPAP